jgi:hypothetical protein
MHPSVAQLRGLATSCRAVALLLRTGLTPDQALQAADVHAGAWAQARSGPHTLIISFWDFSLERGLAPAAVMNRLAEFIGALADRQRRRVTPSGSSGSSSSYSLASSCFSFPRIVQWFRCDSLSLRNPCGVVVDGARYDSDGDIWLLGRVDDVMNVSGHRLSTAEIESSLVGNPIVAVAAVVGAADETTGQAVVAFVILKKSHVDDQTPEEASALLRKHVSDHIGAIARPSKIYIVEELPKTRSGKIMRRLLQDVAEGREIGDTTTLADTSVLNIISAQVH